MLRKIFISVCTIALFNISLPQEESQFEKYKENFKKSYFNVSILNQILLRYSPEGIGNGFTVENTRLKISGDLDNKFGYKFQVDFVNKFTALDASLSYKFSPLLKIEIGQFKTPFGGEFLISTGKTLFINRSKASILVPGRDIGLQLSGEAGKSGFTYAGGVFNGEGTNTFNANNRMLYAGRVGYSSMFANNSSQINFGINGAYTDLKESMIGLDLFLRGGGFIFSAEFIHKEFEAVKVDANHFTVGYKIFEFLELLERFNQFESSISLVTGVNLLLTEFAKIQINHEIDIEEIIGQSSFMVLFQIMI